jgi:hypothetical protein
MNFRFCEGPICELTLQIEVFCEAVPRTAEVGWVYTSFAVLVSSPSGSEFLPPSRALSSLPTLFSIYPSDPTPWLSGLKEQRALTRSRHLPLHLPRRPTEPLKL